MMKKMITLLCMLSAMAGNMWAADSLSVASLSAGPWMLIEGAGAPATVSIQVNNDKQAALQFSLTLPEGISIVKHDNGDYDCSLEIVEDSTSTTSEVELPLLVVVQDSLNHYNFVCYSPTNARMPSGTPLHLNMNLQAEAVSGNVTASIDHIVIADIDGNKQQLEPLTVEIDVEVPVTIIPIDFADAKVKEICVANWDTNGDGELSEEEAAAVTELGQVFKENKEITSFDELRYFTGLTSIGEEAFRECTSLTSITIPESVTNIRWAAFHICSSLTSIHIPENVTHIGHSAFAWCSNLTSINIPENVNNIESSVFADCSSLTSINIPENVTSIGKQAFAGCSGLTAINIPENVTSIGEWAFAGCSGLTAINIPENVTSIGEWAFAFCFSLTSITVAANNPVYDSRNDCNAIIETSSNTLVTGCMNTIIPESVTSIGNSAFYGCSSLTSINIPESVTSIGGHAFRECYSLTSINISASVTSIGVYAFFACSNLTSINIPESVTNIGDGAFKDCSSLTSVTIPESVTNIGEQAFAYCSGLTSVTSYIKNPFTIDSSVFDIFNPFCILYVPAGTKALYEQTDGWHEHFAEIREMEDITDFVTYTIGVDGHGEVVIGNNVIDDGEEETAIEVAKGHQVVVTLQPEEGYRLNKLTVGDVDVTEQVMNNMFVIQNAATDTTLYAIFTEDIEGFVADGIHYGVFKGTNNVKVLPYKYEDEVRIPETVDYGGTRWNVTALADNAFANNSWLYYVSVPRSVNQVGEELFKRCTRLAALSWNPEQTPITRQMVNGRVKNRNMLWFVKDRELFQVPLIGNLVVNGTAEQVVLVDDGSEHGFYNPQDFTAMNIQYTHNYQLETSKGKTMGWETISLPFDVDEYYSATQTAPAYPFATVTGDEVEAGKRPFWLYSYDETSDDFKPATAIEANTPYIISMPNNDFYESIYMLAGNVVFRTQREVTVKASDNLNVVAGSKRAFYPCFQTPYMPDAMGINLQGEGYSEKGSIFMLSGRLYDDIQPFAAYFRYVNGSSKEFFHIFEGMTDGINDMEIPEKVRVKDGNDIYDLAGRRIQRPTRRGIYIVGGRKQVVK